MTQTHALMAGLSAICIATPAFAAPAKPAVQDRLDALERRLEDQQARIERQDATIAAQQAELERLRAQVGGQTASPPLAQAVEGQSAQIATLQENAAQQKLADAERPRIGLTGGRPTLTSPDGRYSIALRATVQLDAAHYAQDAEGPLASDFRRGSVGLPPNRETNAARDLSDGAYFRRARLGVEGVFNRDFGFHFVGEFGGSGTEGPARINDAWISYTGLAPFTFQVGAYSPPANMDDGTSPEDTLFLERASASELSRSLGGADGRLGAGVRFATQRWMGSATFTGRTVNDAEVFDSQAAVVGRMAHLLVASDDDNVHVGASGTWVFAVADQGSSTIGARYPLRFRDRPELRVDSTRLIDTGPIDADHAYVVGLEFAAQHRNLYLQAEHFWFGLDRRNPGALSDPRFRGWYVQGAWTLTGEPRRYNMATGSFQNPRAYSPFSGSGGLGAWELAVRYSAMDLNYHEGLAGLAPPADGVRGGDQRIWTVGLNWYPNANLKFAIDYLRIEVDRLNPAGPGNTVPFGPAPATPPVGAQVGQDLNAVALRGQFGF
jgi:phosphate-selective porin OprO/OprP